MFSAAKYYREIGEGPRSLQKRVRQSQGPVQEGRRKRYGSSLSRLNDEVVIQ